MFTALFQRLKEEGPVVKPGSFRRVNSAVRIFKNPAFGWKKYRNHMCFHVSSPAAQSWICGSEERVGSSALSPDGDGSSSPWIPAGGNQEPSLAGMGDQGPRAPIGLSGPEDLLGPSLNPQLVTHVSSVQGSKEIFPIPCFSLNEPSGFWGA